MSASIASADAATRTAYIAMAVALLASLGAALFSLLGICAAHRAHDVGHGRAGVR